MDADSSYGGSDTAQDCSQNDHNTSDVTIITNDNTFSVTVTTPEPQETQQFYHKNEITLPINCDEPDVQKEHRPQTPKLPHYLSTAKLNINETLENHSNLEQLNKTYNSMSRLNQDMPENKNGVDNPAFEDDAKKSTFDENKPYNNGDLNSSATLGLKSPSKDNEEQTTEAVNLELINMKPAGSNGVHENGSNNSTIPVKKETEVDLGDPYDEYFVPVNEHRKYMRYVFQSYYFLIYFY